ncbi:hypothetical protein CK934_15830 [Chitinophaga sp. MD30]|nr:hypothetical protein CK934_15830 [Chitinophaga sp. MD30]
MLRGTLATFLILIVNLLYAQQPVTLIKGRVNDQIQQPLFLVSIKVLETGQMTMTDKSGTFILPVSGETLTIEFTCIGKQKLTQKIKTAEYIGRIWELQMRELNLGLKEITVSAERKYDGSSNSSVVIDRDVIEQVSALSVNDLLNQLPNRKITPPSLQSVQNIQLRSTFADVQKGFRDPFALSNAFGIAVVMDGVPISNNANMQSRNPGITGLEKALIHSAGSYGLDGKRDQSYSGDYAFGGTDLRQIPVENIERVEVIAGVPSVKYGDLTDGVVIIDRQAGRSPLYVKTQLRDNATAYSLSKGFYVDKYWGSFNISTNYTTSFADNRDKLKAYKRLNANLMWSRSFGQRDQVRNTLSLDYGKNVDGIRSDPDDPASRRTSFDNWNASISNRTNISFNNRFLKSISVNLRYSTGFQQTYWEENANNGITVYTDETKPGITEGKFAPGNYTAISLIEGKPITLSGNINTNTEFGTGNLRHFLSAGSNLNYSANKGRGQVFDPSRPRAQTAVRLDGKLSERYYDYSLIAPQIDMGFYIEDQFSFRLLQHDMNVRAGVRWDIQNGFVSVTPRTNISYQVTDKWRIGFAYGRASKAPGLGHRFPGPVFNDIPLLISYNGKVAESFYLLYIDRFDPSGQNLKASRSETFEFTSLYEAGKYRVSLSMFSKSNRDGISTIQQWNQLVLPVYDTVPRSGLKPEYIQVGTQRVPSARNVFSNVLSADNQGIDLMASSPVFRSISTSFNLSGGIYHTRYFVDAWRYVKAENIPNTRDETAVMGVYLPDKRSSWYSSGRLTSVTHIPKISLMLSFTAEFDFFRRTYMEKNLSVPIAYYTAGGKYVEIKQYDPQNPDYKHLKTYDESLDVSQNQERIHPNFHLSLSKELRKKLKFSFNVFNVFNYQPRYLKNGTVVTPNYPPTFGAEISLKL